MSLIVIAYIVYNSYSGATVRTTLPQSSRHRLSYHLPVGVTELKQCRRAFSLFHGKVTETPVYKEFHYEIKLISVNADDGILLHVRETRNGLPTGGGSSLLALSDSWRRRLCFYDDFFNGVYAIWCPPPAPGTCTRLSVELKYANFSAYTIGYFPVRDGRLWRSTVCWNETTKRRTQSGVGHGLTSPWRTSYAEAPHTCQLDWFGKDDNLSVVNANGVEIPLLDDDAFCRRVFRFRRIIMVGPSHMRYKFNYISLRCSHVFGPKERKHGSAQVNGTTYLKLKFMANISQLWTMHLGPMNLTKDDAVIIQHGSHDLCYIGLRHTLDTSINTYFDRLKAIQRHSELLGFRLIVLTSPPYGDRTIRPTMDGRNTFSLAVLARLVHTRLSVAGIDVFDEFAALLPHYNQDARPCVGHYLCPKRKGGLFIGRSGIVALHLLLRHLAGELDIITC